MLPLRLCYLKLECLFHEDCSLPIQWWNGLTDTLLSGFNVSLVRKPGSLHSLTNDQVEEVDECLLSLERNESDTVLLPYTIPVIKSNIKTGPVFFSDKITIISTYKVENDNPNPGIFDTFDAFGVDALALIINFFFILTVLICLTYILERKSLSRRVRINGRRFKLRFVPWFIFRFFMKQFPSFPGNMTALKVLLNCCLLTFSYFITFFYTSMIKTDMITVKAPRVIGSYQDIVDDPSISPYIRHAFDEYVSFKQAPSESRKRRIWERILKMGVNRLVYNDDVPINFHDPEHPFMHTKAVVMAYASLVDVWKYSTALNLKKMENSWEKRKVLYVFDPTESERLSATVLNRMTEKALSIKYQVRLRRYFEAHFYQKFLDNTGLLGGHLAAQMLGVWKDFSDVDQYVNHRVVLSEPLLLKPNITYFMHLFILYLVLCFIQFIIFVIERWVSERLKENIPEEQ